MKLDEILFDVNMTFVSLQTNLELGEVFWKKGVTLFPQTLSHRGDGLLYLHFFHQHPLMVFCTQKPRIKFQTICILCCTFHPE